MFGAFFFVPEIGSTGYLQAGKQALSKLVYAHNERIVKPIKPPVNKDSDDSKRGLLVYETCNLILLYIVTKQS